MCTCACACVCVLVFDVDVNVCRQLTISLKLENSNKNKERFSLFFDTMCSTEIQKHNGKKTEWERERERANEKVSVNIQNNKFLRYAIKATKHNILMHRE